MEPNEELKAQMIRRAKTLEEIRNLLEYIKQLTNLIAELIEQHQGTCNNSTCCYECRKQLLAELENDEFDRT